MYTSAKLHSPLTGNHVGLRGHCSSNGVVISSQVKPDLALMAVQTSPMASVAAAAKSRLKIGLGVAGSGGQGQNQGGGQGQNQGGPQGQKTTAGVARSASAVGSVFHSSLVGNFSPQAMGAGTAVPKKRNRPKEPVP